MFQFEKFVGTLSAGAHVDFSGPLTVLWTPSSLTVSADLGGLSSRKIELTPFHGGMFLGPLEHRDIDGFFERGYDLTLSGSNLGHFGNGGGKEGDFTIYRFKQVSIAGSLSGGGLSVSISAQTHQATAIDYGSGEKEVRENVYAPTDVRTGFVVPPAYLVKFMGLRALDPTWISRFGWNAQDGL